MRHDAFLRIDEEQYAIHHFEHSLYFATEVCVAWSVDDIDLVITIGDCCIFGKDRDSPLFFDVVTVHHAFLHFLVFRECAALLEKFINKCCFTVINVRNDGNILYFLHGNILTLFV